MFKFLFAAFSIFSVTAMGAPAHAEDNMSYFEDVECDDAGCAERGVTGFKIDGDEQGSGEGTRV